MTNGSSQEGAARQAQTINEWWFKKGILYGAYACNAHKKLAVYGVRSDTVLTMPVEINENTRIIDT